MSEVSGENVFMHFAMDSSCHVLNLGQLITFYDLFVDFVLSDFKADYIPTGFFPSGEVEVELDTKGIQQVITIQISLAGRSGANQN